MFSLTTTIRYQSSKRLWAYKLCLHKLCLYKLCPYQLGNWRSFDSQSDSSITTNYDLNHYNTAKPSDNTLSNHFPTLARSLLEFKRWPISSQLLDLNFRQTGALSLELVPKTLPPGITKSVNNGLPKSIKESLKRLFNITECPPTQAMIITLLNNSSNDYVILAPPSSRLTVSYLIPLLMKFERDCLSKDSYFSMNQDSKPNLSASTSKEFINPFSSKTTYQGEFSITPRKCSKCLDNHLKPTDKENRAYETQATHTIYSVIICPTFDLIHLIAEKLHSLARYSEVSFRTSIISHNYDLKSAIDNILRLEPNVIISTPSRLIKACNTSPQLKQSLSGCKLLIFHGIENLLSSPQGLVQINSIRTFIKGNYLIWSLGSFLDDISKMAISRIARISTTYINFSYFSDQLNFLKSIESKSLNDKNALAAIWGPKSSEKFLDSLGISISNELYKQPTFNPLQSKINNTKSCITSQPAQYLANIKGFNVSITDNPQHNISKNKVSFSSTNENGLVSCRNDVEFQDPYLKELHRPLEYLIIPPSRMMASIYNCIKTHLKDSVTNSKIIIFFPTIRFLQFTYVFMKYFISSQKYSEPSTIDLWSKINILAFHSKLTKDKRIGVLERFTSRSNSILFTTDLATLGLDFFNITLTIQVGPAEGFHQIFSRLAVNSRCEHYLMLNDLEGHFLYEIAKVGILPDTLDPKKAFNVFHLPPELIRFYEDHNQPIQYEFQESPDKNLFWGREYLLHPTSKKWYDNPCLDASCQLMYRSLLGYYSQRAKRFKYEKWQVTSFVNDILLSFGKKDPPSVSKHLAARLGIINSPGLNIQYYADTKTELLSSLPAYPGYRSRITQKMESRA